MFKHTFAALEKSEGLALQWGSALEWGIVICLSVCTLIVISVVATRILYRGRQTERDTMWLHLLGLGIFPLFLLPFLNFTVLEYSKQEVFCASCHNTMQPWIDDLQNPNGKHLAALHYQIRFAPGEECYTCHADYGIHGTFAAKMAGLNDAWVELTGGASTRVAMLKPYPNELCLKCHNNSKYFMAEDSHVDAKGRVTQDILTDNVHCTDCHGSAHNIPGYSGYTPPGKHGRG